ncbi:MAG: hypothetical protein Q8L69_04790, partial [Gallionellaceae bacterium]|nr:hypothetical protein [Gallionellaceae bacterium]
MHHTTTRLFLFILFMLTYGMASAVEYNQVLTKESTVTFGFKQMGVSLDGKFDKFAAQLSFDPAAPDTRSRATS